MTDASVPRIASIRSRPTTPPSMKACNKHKPPYCLTPDQLGTSATINFGPSGFTTRKPGTGCLGEIHKAIVGKLPATQNVWGRSITNDLTACSARYKRVHKAVTKKFCCWKAWPSAKSPPDALDWQKANSNLVDFPARP
ncbi:hypothetical protein PABG_06426 [Paracoccidioides brasiliensis Pb03]|nr:hypothetical protein PABG_06426 [Paracoccidioides brasiliensis Pb03]